MVGRFIPNFPYILDSAISAREFDSRAAKAIWDFEGMLTDDALPVYLSNNYLRRLRYFPPHPGCPVRRRQPSRTHRNG